MCKDLVSRVTRKEIDQRNCVFQKLPFSFGILFYENDIAKLICCLLPPNKLVETWCLLFLNMLYRGFWTWWVREYICRSTFLWNTSGIVEDRGSVSIYMLTSLKYTAKLHEMSLGSECLHGQQFGLFFSKI